MDLQETVKVLNNFAPLELGESWDNVGLLVEPFTNKSINTMLLTNDLTSAVMKEAIDHKVELILSYHPPLFRPIKRISMSNWKDRILSQCLERGIAVYSPHTCYDAKIDGVNDWLISAFGNEISSPLEQNFKRPIFTERVELFLDHSSEDTVFADDFINYLKPLHECQDIQVIKTPSSIIILCNKTSLLSVLAHPKGSRKLTITELQKQPQIGVGSGRMMKLTPAITVEQCVTKVKQHLNLVHVRLALGENKSLASIVGSVGVCAGAGASVLRNVKCNLVVTGEMSHHEVLDLVHKGISVILTDHSNSERGFIAQVLKPQLQKLFQDKIKILVSEIDADPLVVV